MAKKLQRPFLTVRHWLRANGKTQSELADAVGISKQHLSNVLQKSRSCSFATAMKLSRICNVPVESIATDEQLSGRAGRS